MNKELDKLIDLMFDADIDIEEIVKEENILEYIKKIKQASNEKIDALYKTIDAQNKTINEQALEIAKLKEKSMNGILEVELDLLDSDMTASITNTLKNGKEFVLYSPKYVNKLENKIDKAIEILKDTNVNDNSVLLITTIDYALHILGDKENE